MDKSNKKMLFYTILIIGLLIVLVTGATYAYFNVPFTRATETVKAIVEGPPEGSVVITSGEVLSLNMERAGMMQQDADKTFYATTNGKPVEEQEEKPVVATATAIGSYTFNCDYKLHVAMDGTMYDAFQKLQDKSKGQIVLTVDNNEYDFADSTPDFTKGFDVTGQITNLNANNPQKINAQFKIVNKTDKNQTDLKGTNVKFTFSIVEFTCK